MDPDEQVDETVHQVNVVSRENASSRDEASAWWGDYQSGGGKTESDTA